jgi:hypothetical protein
LRHLPERRYDRGVASESRRMRRIEGTANRSSAAPAPAMVDPLSPDRIKSVLLRLGVPLLVIWVLGIIIAGFAVSPVIKSLALGVPAALTLAAIGLMVWVVRQAKKAQGVAGILSRAAATENDKDARQAALAELGSKYKGNDPTAIFARAQLLLQEDPRKALEALEGINLSKVMASVGDEARGQRAMIHLMLGEVSAARDLVDGIQLARHQDARSRAMLAAVVAEAWARSGQAKRAVDTLSVINADDPELAQLKPQLLRAQAYAFAYAEDMKSARRALRKLGDQDVRLLGGFVTKKTHPLLQREAKKLLEQSGAVQRRVQVQRR